MANTLPLLDAPSRKFWRAWLKKNHARESGVWLVAWKVASGKCTLAYEDAVEEALCFGWIDSTIRALDEFRFLRKFTPRKDASNWSDLNLKRFERVKAAGLVTEAGLRVFAPAAQKRASVPMKAEGKLPNELVDALRRAPKAHGYFAILAPSYRRQYARWIAAAKRPETRARRSAEAVALLAEGKKLGMK